jgi:hypothetical protein
VTLLQTQIKLGIRIAGAALRGILKNTLAADESNVAQTEHGPDGNLLDCDAV